MNQLIIYIAMALLLIILSGCTGDIFSTDLIVLRGNSSGSGSSGGSTDAFYLDIGNSYYNDVHWNVSQYSGADYHFAVRNGRHFVIQGDQV